MAVRGGIDLGTTYSGISWFDTYNDRVDTIDLETADGAKVMRSVVYYPEEGRAPVVGETAWNTAKQSPERVIVGIKRAMGTAFKTNPIDGVQYTPQQVSAEILKVLVKDAQTFLGEEVKDVVITVPAYFGDNERFATEEAGKLAGVNVLWLLPEPHAAALAFAIDKIVDIVDKYLLVYDLGGGTFDVTLIHATTSSDAGNTIDLKIETLCKDGNASLGGLDWDRVLADIVAEKVKQAYGIDVRQDPKTEAILLDNCEKAKRHLTRNSSAPVIAGLPTHQVEVSVSEFEDRTRDLVLQTQMLLEQVLDMAQQQYNVGKDQIDVMLTGGSSRMPMVKKMIEGVMGKPPIQHRNPELLVTIGAAYWAHLLQSGNTVTTRVRTEDGTVAAKAVTVSPGGLVDRSVYAVGVEILRPDGQGQMVSGNAVVIPANAKYGEVFEKEFGTAYDGQTGILINLYKGDSLDLSECTLLVDFTISGLPEGRPQGQPVKVTLGYNASGIICGSAWDVNTGQKVDIVVDRSKIAS